MIYAGCCPCHYRQHLPYLRGLGCFREGSPPARGFQCSQLPDASLAAPTPTPTRLSEPVPSLRLGGGWTRVGQTVPGSWGPRSARLGPMHLVSPSQAEPLFIARELGWFISSSGGSQEGSRLQAARGLPGPPPFSFSKTFSSVSLPRASRTLPGPHPGPAWQEPASLQPLGLLVGFPSSPQLAEQKTGASVV